MCDSSESDSNNIDSLISFISASGRRMVRTFAPLRSRALAEHLKVSVQRINELVRGKRGVTPETAWLLAQALNTTPEFWLNLQIAYDLAITRPARQVSRLRRAS